MRIKLYLFLPRTEAEELVRSGFPDSSRRYRLSPEEYTACSAFNRNSLVELGLEMPPTELNRYRHELELPVEDFEGEEDAFGSTPVDPIYWYEFPARVLRACCRSLRIMTNRDGGRV